MSGIRIGGWSVELKPQNAQACNHAFAPFWGVETEPKRLDDRSSDCLTMRPGRAQKRYIAARFQPLNLLDCLLRCFAVQAKHDHCAVRDISYDLLGTFWRAAR
jgi:hypothetical protein